MSSLARGGEIGYDLTISDTAAVFPRARRGDTHYRDQHRRVPGTAPARVGEITTDASGRSRQSGPACPRPSRRGLALPGALPHQSMRPSMVHYNLEQRHAKTAQNL